MEYLLVGAALIISVCGLGALWRFVSGDGLSSIVQQHASHSLEDALGVIDVLQF